MGGAGGWKEGGEKAKEGMRQKQKELNDKRRDAKKGAGSLKE